MFTSILLSSRGANEMSPKPAVISVIKHFSKLIKNVTYDTGFFSIFFTFLKRFFSLLIFFTFLHFFALFLYFFAWDPLEDITRQVRLDRYLVVEDAPSYT